MLNGERFSSREALKRASPALSSLNSEYGLSHRLPLQPTIRSLRTRNPLMADRRPLSDEGNSSARIYVDHFLPFQSVVLYPETLT
jgi:hypothetical protein